MTETFTHNAGGYTNHGCRCPDCRAAHAAYVSAARARRIANGAPTTAHGKPSTFDNYACRCDLCVAAKRASRQKASA